MARQISVSDEVYQLLTRRKGSRSFSEVIKELEGMSKRPEKQNEEFFRFAGIFKGDKELKRIEELIARDRRRNSGRKFKW